MIGTEGFVRRTGVVAVLIAVTVSLAGCAERQDIALCGGDVDRVEIFNYYRDHDMADRQVLDDPDEIAYNCSARWSYDEVRTRKFDDDDLARRATTVLTMHHTDGTTRTYWAHRLAGVHAGTAIITESGESFYLPNNVLPQYHAPDADVVDRDEVPER